MNLLCPSCQKQVSVPDQYSGQQMQCPLCSSAFTVPVLPPSPSAPPPPTFAPPPPLRVSEPPVQGFAPPPSSAPAPLPPKPSAPAPAPAPPLVMRDYERLCSCTISPTMVPWFSVGSVGLLFLLSFFPWWGVNVWSYGKVNALFIFYYLFLTFGLLTTIASLLWELKVIPAVPVLMPWRAVIAGSFIASAFLMLFFYYVSHLFEHGAAGASIWGILGFWTHFVAVISLLLEIWLQRRGPTRPAPRIDFHW